MQVTFTLQTYPVYIKEPVVILSMSFSIPKKSVIPYAVRLPVYAKTKYSVECELTTMTTPTFLKLSLYAGSREEAERMAVYFKNEPNIVYETILTAFNEELHHISED